MPLAENLERLQTVPAKLGQTLASLITSWVLLPQTQCCPSSGSRRPPQGASFPASLNRGVGPLHSRKVFLSCDLSLPIPTPTLHQHEAMLVAFHDKTISSFSRPVRRFLGYLNPHLDFLLEWSSAWFR